MYVLFNYGGKKLIHTVGSLSMDNYGQFHLLVFDI